MRRDRYSLTGTRAAVIRQNAAAATKYLTPIMPTGNLVVVLQPATVLCREIVSMNSKLDVTVAVDLGSGTITITPAGELTLRNIHGLLPVVRRAASLAQDFSITVDLRELDGADPQAVQLLVITGPLGLRFLGSDIHAIVQSKPGKHPLQGTRRPAHRQGAA